MIEPTEAEIRGWLRRMRDGNAEALALLFEYAYESLEKMAGPMIGRDPTVAAYAEYGDLFHEALLRLIRRYERNRDAVPEDGGTLRLQVLGTLRDVRIEMNRSLNGPRGLARNQGGSIEEKDVAPATRGPGPYTASMHQDRKEQIQAAVETLPEDLRRVVTLYFVEQRTRPEAAASLGLKLHQYNSRLAEGLTLLKPALARFVGTR